MHLNILLEAIDVDRSDELRQLGINLRFVVPPIVLFAPILRQSFHVGEGSAVVPIAVVDLVGEGGRVEFLRELFEFGVGDGDLVGFDEVGLVFHGFFDNLILVVMMVVEVRFGGLNWVQRTSL